MKPPAAAMSDLVQSSLHVLQDFKTSSVSLSCHHAKVDSRLSLNIAAREPTIIGVDSNPSCSKFVSQFEIFNSSKPSDSNHLYEATFINLMVLS